MIKLIVVALFLIIAGISIGLHAKGDLRSKVTGFLIAAVFTILALLIGLA